MAGSHSKLSVVKVDTYLGVLTDVSAFCDSFKIPQELEENEVTTFGATDEDYIAGFGKSMVEMGGPWRREVDNFFSPIYAAFKAGTLASVSVEYGPEGADTGDVKKTAELVLLKWSGAEAAVKNPQKWSASFRVKAPGVTVAAYS